MRKQAVEIIQELRKLDAEFPELQDEFKALFLEKDLERIFGKAKFQGCWIREMEEGKLNVGHPQAEITTERTAYNAVNIIIRPYGDPIHKFN